MKARKNKRQGGLLRDRSGAAAIEFALVVPLLRGALVAGLLAAVVAGLVAVVAAASRVAAR